MEAESNSRPLPPRIASSSLIENLKSIAISKTLLPGQPAGSICITCSAASSTDWSMTAFERTLISRFRIRPSLAMRIFRQVTNFWDDRTIEVGCCQTPKKRSWIILKYQPNCEAPPAPGPSPAEPDPLPLPVDPVLPEPLGPSAAVFPPAPEALGLGEPAVAAGFGEAALEGVLELVDAVSAGGEVGSGVAFGGGFGVAGLEWLASAWPARCHAGLGVTGFGRVVTGVGRSGFGSRRRSGARCGWRRSGVWYDDFAWSWWVPPEARSRRGARFPPSRLARGETSGFELAGGSSASPDALPAVPTAAPPGIQMNFARGLGRCQSTPE